MQRPPLGVLIVGVGLTGLTMACELLCGGVTCRLLDKSATPAVTSRALCPLEQEQKLIKYLRRIYFLSCQGSSTSEVDSSVATSRK